MIDLTMWVLQRNGELWRDRYDRVPLFATKTDAINYWADNVLASDTGWEPTKVKVSDAK